MRSVSFYVNALVQLLTLCVISAIIAFVVIDSQFKCGAVSERLKVRHWKCRVRKRTGGSNPLRSAKMPNSRLFES